MANIITVAYPSTTAQAFTYFLGGLSHTFIVLYNNYSNELELICNTASGAQVFRRNLVDGANMLAGYFSGTTMVYQSSQSTADNVVITVTP